MAELVYILCAATSVWCAWLLLRGYRRSRAGLLFWSGLCFVGLALNNITLFVDLVILPAEVDLTVPRALLAVAAMAVLLYGLIWEAE